MAVCPCGLCKVVVLQCISVCYYSLSGVTIGHFEVSTSFFTNETVLGSSPLQKGKQPLKNFCRHNPTLVKLSILHLWANISIPACYTILFVFLFFSPVPTFAGDTMASNQLSFGKTQAGKTLVKFRHYEYVFHRGYVNGTQQYR